MIRKWIMTEAQKAPPNAQKENNAQLPNMHNKNPHAASVAEPGQKRGKPMTDRQKQIIRDMRQQGISYNTIAVAHGISSNTVKSFCRRESINVQINFDDKGQNLCKNCGTPLKHHPGSKKKTFCNDKCRYTWWNKNRKYYIHNRYGEGLQ